LLGGEGEGGWGGGWGVSGKKQRLLVELKVTEYSNILSA